jgi:hypothetical protein
MADAESRCRWPRPGARLDLAGLEAPRSTVRGALPRSRIAVIGAAKGVSAKAYDILRRIAT